MPEMIPAPVMKRRARPWMIALGFILLLGASFNSTRLPPPQGQAEAIGSLVGFLFILGLSGWLIFAGWPRDYTLGVNFRKARRRTWYKLAGLGLLVMFVSFAGLAMAGWMTAAVLVSWVYWFGWTWISWRIASKQAERKVGGRYV